MFEVGGLFILVVIDVLLDFLGLDVDLVLVYGDGCFLGWECVLFFLEVMVLVVVLVVVVFIVFREIMGLILLLDYL